MLSIGQSIDYKAGRHLQIAMQDHSQSMSCRVIYLGYQKCDPTLDEEKRAKPGERKGAKAMSIIVACLHAPQPMEILPTKRIFDVSTVVNNDSLANISLQCSISVSITSTRKSNLG